MTSNPDSSETTASVLPRLALLVTDPVILSELEQILRIKYSSFLLLTDREKLQSYNFPLVIITDTVRDSAEITDHHPVQGTRILVILNTTDEEVAAAAINSGAEDCVCYPFNQEDVFEKIDRCLDPHPVKSV